MWRMVNKNFYPLKNLSESLRNFSESLKNLSESLKNLSEYMKKNFWFLENILWRYSSIFKMCWRILNAVWGKIKKLWRKIYKPWRKINHSWRIMKKFFRGFNNGECTLLTFWRDAGEWIYAKLHQNNDMQCVCLACRWESLYEWQTNVSISWHLSLRVMFWRG